MLYGFSKNRRCKQGLWQCRRGAAAVEFALSFSIILMPLMLGGVEIYLFTRTAQQINDAALATAKVVAYSEEITNVTMQNQVMLASRAILSLSLAPNGNSGVSGTYDMRVSYLQPVAGTGTYEVDWCAQNAGSDSSEDRDAIRDDFNIRYQNLNADNVGPVVYAEITANYQSALSGGVFGDRQIVQRAIFTLSNLLDDIPFEGFGGRDGCMMVSS